MYSVSNDYHIALINDMLSGNVDPINKNVSSVKQLIPDLQAVVFDMVLLVNRFISANDRTLEYVNRQTFNMYNESANLLLKNIITSVNNSQIIDERNKKEYLKSPENTNEQESIYYGEDNILYQLTSLISNDKIKYNPWYIGLKSIIDMLNFIKSSSVEFNMNIRPILRTYITKSYELTASVEKANSLLKEKNFFQY